MMLTGVLVGRVARTWSPLYYAGPGSSGVLIGSNFTPDQDRYYEIMLVKSQGGVDAYLDSAFLIHLTPAMVADVTLRAVRWGDNFDVRRFIDHALGLRVL